MYTSEEYEIYRKVKRELLFEDAKNHLKDYLADDRDCYPWDIDDAEIEEHDIDAIVEMFEEHFDHFDPFGDVWHNIIADYIEEF